MDGDVYDGETGEITPITERQTVPPVIAAAIIAVKKQVKQLGADDKNEHGRYNFVSVDKFYERIGRLMAEAGIALLIDETITDVRASDKSGNPWLFAQYDLTFMHESGALSHPLHRSIALPISGPQAFGAAQSYIEKQFLRQVFKVPTGDKDADDTAPAEGAPSRNAARTAQVSSPAATTAHPRPQAAPAPSDAAQDANKRRAELRTEIEASMTVEDVESWRTAPAWKSCRAAVVKAATEAGNSKPEEVANSCMGVLEDMIESRKAMLTAQAAEGGY
jgi:hypothetical protein